MTVIRKYFIFNDQSKADCKLCFVYISRGGTAASFYNTSHLIKLPKDQTQHEELITCSKYQQRCELGEKKVYSQLRVSENNSATQCAVLKDEQLSVFNNEGGRNRKKKPFIYRYTEPNDSTILHSIQDLLIQLIQLSNALHLNSTV